MRGELGVTVRSADCSSSECERSEDRGREVVSCHVSCNVQDILYLFRLHRVPRREGFLCRVTSAGHRRYAWKSENKAGLTGQTVPGALFRAFLSQLGVGHSYTLQFYTGASSPSKRHAETD